MPETCAYWEGCPNPATHEYGGYPYCGDHDVRPPEEATIGDLRAENRAQAARMAEAEGRLYAIAGMFPDLITSCRCAFENGRAIKCVFCRVREVLHGEIDAIPSLWNKYGKLNARADAAEARVRVLTEALEFYAKTSSWSSCSNVGIARDDIVDYSDVEIVTDEGDRCGGKRAREALVGAPEEA